MQRQIRPGMPTGSLTPAMHPSHLRRESSQSSHTDMGNGGMGPNGGRGGYLQHGGRGRGMASQYNQSMPYSPNTAYRSVPNAPRGGQGGPTPFSNQTNRSLGAYPHSPHQSARSPSLANSQPIHPQPGQMPMPSPGMQQAPYGGFNQHISPHQVNPHFSSASASKAPSSRQKTGRPAVSHLKQPVPSYLPDNLSPESGHFEYFLMHRNSQGQFMPQPFDPNYGFSLLSTACHSRCQCPNTCRASTSHHRHGHLIQVPKASIRNNTCLTSTIRRSRCREPLLVSPTGPTPTLPSPLRQ